MNNLEKKRILEEEIREIEDLLDSRDDLYQLGQNILSKLNDYLALAENSNVEKLLEERKLLDNELVEINGEERSLKIRLLEIEEEKRTIETRLVEINRKKGFLETELETMNEKIQRELITDEPISSPNFEELLQHIKDFKEGQIRVKRAKLYFNGLGNNSL